ncbi:MAG: histidine kinase [Bacteroidetes bacterium]|nr:histidine kinase [Bacteroidota bacterium]
MVTAKSEIKWPFHLLGWIIFFIAPLLLSPGPLGHNLTVEALVSLLVRNTILMLFFYLNLLYLTPVFLRRYGLTYFAIVLLMLIIAISSFNVAFHQYYAEGRNMLGPHMPPPDDALRPRHDPPVMLASPEFSSLLITLMVAAASSLLVFRTEWVRREEEKKEQLHQKITAELTALKLQISPHFLFNTLNNIRWLVRSKSENAEDAVVKLSHLMRYMLYQTEAEKVDLERELNHLIDFIDLQKIRVSEVENVQISILGNPGGKVIVPLLLLPLVENFFKHGDFTTTNQNSISIVIDNDRLKFNSTNRISTQVHQPGGIGLSNVKRRLELHYPGQYALKYYEKDFVFYLELEITLRSNYDDG